MFGQYISIQNSNDYLQLFSLSLNLLLPNGVSPAPLSPA